MKESHQFLKSGANKAPEDANDVRVLGTVAPQFLGTAAHPTSQTAPKRLIHSFNML